VNRWLGKWVAWESEAKREILLKVEAGIGEESNIFSGLSRSGSKAPGEEDGMTSNK